MKNEVFVFGSNLAGIHGAGAAAYAHERCGAKWGLGEGLSGNSYALPTKDENVQTLPLERIQQHVDEFRMFAVSRPDLNFMVTQIGCGLAGYTPADIAPMFNHAPDNVFLPMPFVHALLRRGRLDHLFGKTEGL